MRGERKQVGRMEKSLGCHFVYDGCGLSYGVERIGNKGFSKENYWESYYKPRNEKVQEATYNESASSRKNPYLRLVSLIIETKKFDMKNWLGKIIL